MTLPSSGDLSVTQIVTEFAGTLPATLSDYLRGGGKTTVNNTNVATNLPLSVSQFYGATRTTSGSLVFNNTNGTWTVPPYTTITVTLEAGHGYDGGNGAGGSGFSNPGGAGGTGGKSVKTYTYPALTIGASIPYVVGQGGAAGAAGTATTFNSNIIANAGTGGTDSYVTFSGGTDGDATPHDGVPGTNGTASGGDSNTTGGSSITGSATKGKVTITWS